MVTRAFNWIRAAVGAGLVGLVCVGAWACSTPSGVSPADAEYVRKIAATVEQMRMAYTGKDAGVFQSLFMPLERLRKMEAEIQRDFAEYAQISLDVAIDRVMVEESEVAVHVHWQGQWQALDDGPPLPGRGHAVFPIVRSQALMPSAVDGDAPFGMSARRIHGERPRAR